MADEQEREKEYEVKDKRRVNVDGTLRDNDEARQAEPEEPQPAAEAAPGPEPEAGERPEEQEMPPPNVYDLLQFVAGMLSEQAWLHMGIRLAPGQKEPTRDLAQAKIAIDMVVFIADKLHPHIGEDERRALRGLISDLQLNFVRQSG